MGSFVLINIIIQYRTFYGNCSLNSCHCHWCNVKGMFALPNEMRPKREINKQDLNKIHIESLLRDISW